MCIMVNYQTQHMYTLTISYDVYSSAYITWSSSSRPDWFVTIMLTKGGLSLGCHWEGAAVDEER